MRSVFKFLFLCHLTVANALEIIRPSVMIDCREHLYGATRQSSS